ncbi:MAG: mechanosensitive ion channel family protein, partial [Oscillospiraceae bacterium]
MFTHPFRCGDFVEINGVTGTVKAITILYTRLLTVDNKAVLIPNGKVSSATIINYTYEEYRKLEMHFSISYSQDFHKAIAVIKDVISKNPLALNKPEEPLVVVSEHGESAVKILVRVCVKSEDYWELNYALLEQVKDRFDSEGIEIPYNKLDVQLKMKT